MLGPPRRVSSTHSKKQEVISTGNDVSFLIIFRARAFGHSSVALSSLAPEQKINMFDFSDDEYDYGLGTTTIEPDSLYLAELMEIQHQNQNSNSLFSSHPHHRDQFLRNPSSHPNFTYKEGKLIVNISDIQGILSSFTSTNSTFCQFSTLFGTSYECVVSFDDISYNFMITSAGPSSTSIGPSLGSSPSQDFIFDIFEYYGGMILKIILMKKTLLTKIVIGEIHFSLHDLILAQRHWEQQVEYIPLSIIREQHSSLTNSGGGGGSGHSTPTSSHVLPSFWGYQTTVKINTHQTSPTPQHSQHPQITLRLSTRYIPLQSCLHCSPNSRYYNLQKSELHHLCMTGSALVLTSVIELLARKNCLKAALSCRESVDGLHGYNALELALVCRNVPVVRVLLQRAGNLCFGGINSTSSLLPMALVNSPFDHLGLLHQSLDLLPLLRDHTSPFSSSSPASASASPPSSSSYFTHFTPHSSIVATTTSLPPPPPHIPPSPSPHSPCHSFQTQYPLSSEEIILYTGGSPVHLAILGGSDCLQILLNFLMKYFTVITGWEGVSSLGDMIEYTANRYDDLTPFMLACLLGDERSARLLFDLKKSTSSSSSSSASPTTPSAPTNTSSSPQPQVGSGSGSGGSQHLISLKYSSKCTGYTPLMLTCYSGNLEILKLLLNSYEPLDSQLPLAPDGLNTARQANSSSRKVLEKYFNQESLVSLLSCVPMARDSQGRQAITIAAMCGHVSLVQLLIQRGVSYGTGDRNGMTPLHYGAYYGHSDVCDLIIQTEYFLTLRFESFQQNQSRRNKYSILKGHGSSTSSSSHPQKDLEEEPQQQQPQQPPPHHPQQMTGRENLLKDSDEYYSYHLLPPMSKTPSSFSSSAINAHGGGGGGVKSLNFMTRKPYALLRMDLFGNRPADIAIRRCFPDITIRLHIAVLEIYGMSHPPTYSNIVNSEPLVLGLIEEKLSSSSKKGNSVSTATTSSSMFCPGPNPNGGSPSYHPLPSAAVASDKSSPLHSKLSSMIPLPFHFLPLRSGSNTHLQCIEKQIPLECSQVSTVTGNPNTNNTSTELDLGGGGGGDVAESGVIVEEDEWTREDEWAVNAAYNFATTLSFPTPPPSPTTINLRRPFGEDEGDEKQ
jgi:hypothetical protein